MCRLSAEHLNSNACRDRLRGVSEFFDLRTECNSICGFKLHASDARTGAQLGRRPVRNDLAAINNADLIGDLNLIKVMGGEDHGGLLTATDRVKVAGNRAPRLWVKANGWLVEKEDLRSMEERARNLKLATHAS